MPRETRMAAPVSFIRWFCVPFCAYPLRRALFKELQVAAGRSRHIAIAVPSFSVVAAMLEATDLVAVLPSKLLSQTRRNLHVFETPVPVQGFCLNAYWPDRLDADPLQRWFRDFSFAALAA